MADRKAQYYIERMEQAIPHAENGMIGVSVEAAKEIIGLLKEQQKLIDEITQRRANDVVFD